MSNKSRYSAHVIQVWFLDEDFQKSASMLSNEMLVKSEKGCMQALVTARFYFIGIRSKKFYEHFFSKQNKTETLDKFFPCWPFSQPPSFTHYSSKFSKWARKCAEHLEYIQRYLEVLCNEHQYRFRKQPNASKFIEWLSCDAPPLHVPKANLKKLTLEWKALPVKFRKKDILAGYRAYYKAIMINNAIKADDFTARDIPEFLLDESQKKSDLSKWME